MGRLEGWKSCGQGGVSKPWKAVALKTKREAVVPDDCWTHCLCFWEHGAAVHRHEGSQKCTSLKESD